MLQAQRGGLEEKAAGERPVLRGWVSCLVQCQAASPGCSPALRAVSLGEDKVAGEGVHVGGEEVLRKKLSGLASRLGASDEELESSGR